MELIIRSVVRADESVSGESTRCPLISGWYSVAVIAARRDTHRSHHIVVVVPVHIIITNLITFTPPTLFSVVA